MLKIKAIIKIKVPKGEGSNLITTNITTGRRFIKKKPALLVINEYRHLLKDVFLSFFFLFCSSIDIQRAMVEILHARLPFDNGHLHWLLKLSYCDEEVPFERNANNLVGWARKNHYSLHISKRTFLKKKSFPKVPRWKTFSLPKGNYKINIEPRR